MQFGKTQQVLPMGVFFLLLNMTIINIPNVNTRTEQHNFINI